MGHSRGYRPELAQGPYSPGREVGRDHEHGKSLEYYPARWGCASYRVGPSGFPGFAGVGPKSSSLFPGVGLIPQCTKAPYRLRTGEGESLCAWNLLRFESLHRRIFRLLRRCQLNANARSKHRPFLARLVKYHKSRSGSPQFRAGHTLQR